MFRNRLTPFALVLVSGASAYAGLPRLAQPQLNALKAQEGARTTLAMQKLQSLSASLGLGADSAFQVQRSSTDAFGILHVHVRQAYKGVPVWGGDAILHTDAENQPLPMTDKLVRGLNVGATPALEASEALAIASRDMAPKGAFAYTPTSQLVVVPRIQRSLRAGVAAARANASDVVSTVTGADLAWHLHLEMQSQGDSRAIDYLISATNGAVLKKWSSRETAGTPAVGIGNSQYSGTVNIATNQLSATSYEMRDSLRGGTTVTDMANATGSGMGALYTDADNTWGDGNNYYDGTTVGGTSGVTGQTAAVDAKFGFEATWDYYKNVHGRNGIDNNGTATTLRMHYANNYDNAFWSDGCFCMTFGDGSAPTTGGFKNLTAIDVIGHELSHGVIANSVPGGLTYADESGGLNEADSDINGTFISYYGYNGATGSTVPNTIPPGNLHGYVPWEIGPQLASSPLRYMIKPSKDGGSPNAWYFDIGNLDVHNSSGPMNRAMYFLAQGATTTATDDTYSSYLPGGMTGIGNDKASKIWYYVMTNGLTSNATYHDARIACETAATTLYGATELAAVQNAFHAINVGPVAGQPDDTQAPTGVTATESGTAGTITFGATANDNVGVERIDFSVDGTVWAQLNAPGSATFDSHLLPNGPHSLIATAFDAYRNHTGSSPVAFSTLNAYQQFLMDGGFEQGGLNWNFGGVAGVISGSLAHGGTHYAIVGQAGTGDGYAYQTFQVPAGVQNLGLDFWTRISSTSVSASATDQVYIQIYDASLSTVLGQPAVFSNLNKTGTTGSAASWVHQTPIDLKAFAGQTVNLVVISSSTENATTFRFDDFALTTTWPTLHKNSDGLVDGIALGMLAKAYSGTSPTTDPSEDLNGDTKTDDADADILLQAFGTTGY